VFDRVSQQTDTCITILLVYNKYNSLILLHIIHRLQLYLFTY